MAINKLILYYKRDFAPALACALEARAWLADRGCETWLIQGGDSLPDSVRSAECAVVFGGDGTILGLARALAGSAIPIFGVNFGKIGFLTVVPGADWRAGLTGLLAGDYRIHFYTALKWRRERAGRLMESGVCANDLTLNRCCPARLLSTAININGVNMGALRSDGLIVCAPLGSSGYCVSAGGPVIFPKMRAIGLVPICPFPLGAASLVLPDDAVIKLTVNPAPADCYCTADGQDGLKLATGDVIEISGWENALAFYGGESLFFARLASRGFCLEK